MTDFDVYTHTSKTVTRVVMVMDPYSTASTSSDCRVTFVYVFVGELYVHLLVGAHPSRRTCPRIPVSSEPLSPPGLTNWSGFLTLPERSPVFPVYGSSLLRLRRHSRNLRLPTRRPEPSSSSSSTPRSLPLGGRGDTRFDSKQHLVLSLDQGRDEVDDLHVSRLSHSSRGCGPSIP